MATSRRRAPVRRKSVQQPKRKRRPVKQPVNFRDGLMKALIGLVLIVDIVLVVFIVRQCSKPTSTQGPPPVQEETRVLQIEVLNGCGVSGVANEFTDFLRANGFDVIKTDNYESFNVLRTVVIDRRGNLQNSQRIADALGLQPGRVLQEVNEAYLLDATVILGKDYTRLTPWQQREN